MISELLHSFHPVSSSSHGHFLRCSCHGFDNVDASEPSSRLPCVLAAALLRLIHPFRSFHCRPSLQSWFIASLSDSNLDPLVASFQPQNGRSSKSCRSSTAIESSSPPVHSLTVHLILKHPGCLEECQHLSLEVHTGLSVPWWCYAVQNDRSGVPTKLESL